MINKHAVPIENAFKFSHVNPTEVMRLIDLLYTTKANSGCIPAKTLKATKDIVCPYLTDCYKLCPLLKNGDPIIRQIIGQ